MELCHLREKIEKLIFINNLIYGHGVESLRALYTLEDEIKEFEAVYMAVKDKLERCI